MCTLVILYIEEKFVLALISSWRLPEIQEEESILGMATDISKHFENSSVFPCTDTCFNNVMGYI